MTLKYVREILARKGPLPSSEIQRELVLKHNLSRDAARKRIQRSHSSGEINRFMRLKAGGYLYYLPNEHSKGTIINTCRSYLHSYRPRLERIIRLVDTFKLISVFELSRLVNLRALVQLSLTDHEYDLDKFLAGVTVKMNPKLVKTLEDLKLLGIGQKAQFLVSSSLDSKATNELIKKARKKFEEEAHLLYVARNYFESHRWAREITLYRSPRHQSLSNKFDAIGHGGFRRKATIILELYHRRPVLDVDLIGYSERIWSTISRRKFPKPVFCYVLASRFSKDSLRSAFEKGMRVIEIDENLNFHLVQSFQVSRTKEKTDKKLRGRAADTQGRAFESAVERVFRRQGFKTETRKQFYLRGNTITEERTKRILTDIDVYALKDNEKALLIECKSAKKQISRRKLLSLVRNLSRIAGYLNEKIGKSLLLSAIVIGYCNRLDMIDARKRADVNITFPTPEEFYKKYRRYLKGEPKWLFVD